MGYRGQSLASLGRTEPMDAAARRTVERVGPLMHDRVRENTPVAKPPPGHEREWLDARKRAPGTLKESWKVGEVTVLEGGHRYSIDVYTFDRIAPYVEWPTMPHIIVPRRPGGMLRFWTKLGATVYAMIVHHTGTKGSYMLATGMAEVAQLWQDIGREELDRWAREQAMVIG